MIVEEVYSIAIHLPEKELERLYRLLEKRDCKQIKVDCNHPKKKLITENQARKYLFKNGIKVKMTVLQFDNFIFNLLYHNLVRFSSPYSALPRRSPTYPVAHTIHFRNFAL